MPLLTESFDLIRVINLPDRTDRYNEVTRQLQALGLEWKQGSVEVYAATRPTELAGFPSLGSRGCFMSHLGVLRDALHRGVENVLVLEDDCDVPSRNCAVVGEVALGLKNRDWQFVHLGHIAPIAPPPAGTPPLLIEFTGHLQNLHMYGVHRSALAPLVEYLEGCLVRPPGPCTWTARSPCFVPPILNSSPSSRSRRSLASEAPAATLPSEPSNLFQA